MSTDRSRCAPPLGSPDLIRARPDRRLRVSVLGPVRAWLGERELSLGLPQQRALFAALAAATGRSTSRDELIDEIWGASPPVTAAGSVYTHISVLRRAIAAAAPALRARDVLTSGPAGYVLRLSPSDLDSERFTTMCAEAQALHAAGDLTGAATRYDIALSLWRGEAYAGLPGHRLENERARLAGHRLTALAQRARIAVDLDDDDVVADLAALVREHPVNGQLPEVLMLALERVGRRAEALDVYRAHRRHIRAELGVEPIAALTALYDRLRAAPVPADRLAGSRFAGRETELKRLRRLVRIVAGGRGGTVWIEGGPGVGKSELLTAAFADVRTHGCRLVRGAGSVPRQALSPGATSADDVLAAVRDACAQAPLVLVVDDLHQAGENDVLLWDRLAAATRRMPLLLVAAVRPTPGRPAVPQLRGGVEARQGLVLTLGDLPRAVIENVVAGVVGGRAGPLLTAIVGRAGGNPLYAREMAAGLIRRGAVRVTDGVADIGLTARIDPTPSRMTSARAALATMSADTLAMLRRAALLGDRFTVQEIVAVTGRPPLDLIGGLEEARAAAVVMDADPHLAFRDPAVRTSLYESFPDAERAQAHRQAAEALDRAGGAVTTIARQLLAGPAVLDVWTLDWLAGHHAELARQVPQLAAELLRRATPAGGPDSESRRTLLSALVTLEVRLGRSPVDEIREAIRLADEPGDRARLRHLLAELLHRLGDTTAAVRVARQAIADADAPENWRSRHRALLVGIGRDGDVPARPADEAHEAASAHQTKWLTCSIRRDHESALTEVDRALAVTRDRPVLAGMHLDLLDNRMFTLHNLDRLDEAERLLREAALFGLRRRLSATLPTAAAVHHYWRGRWDYATAIVSGIAPDTALPGNQELAAASMLLHGVAALIAARRGDVALAEAYLDGTETQPATGAERENGDFLLAARATVAEQQNRPTEALDTLEPLLNRQYAPLLLRHQWLPMALRLALAENRRDVAERIADLSAVEAAKETHRARAWAASIHCRALLDGDPGPALTVADHYRRLGRIAELAVASEDAAVLLAAGRHPHEAARAGGEAVRIYTSLGADWDSRRARRRLAEFGIEPAGISTD